MVPLFGAAYAAPNKGTTILYWFRPPKTVLNPLGNGKIQGLFNAFVCFSSTFQGKFYFQGPFKTVMYIQVLFKPVRTLIIHNQTMGLQNFRRYQKVVDRHTCTVEKMNIMWKQTKFAGDIKSYAQNVSNWSHMDCQWLTSEVLGQSNHHHYATNGLRHVGALWTEGCWQYNCLCACCSPSSEYSINILPRYQLQKEQLNLHYDQWYFNQYPAIYLFDAE